MHSAGEVWELQRFLDRLDAWAEQEKAGTDLQILVLSWVMSRSEDPYQGVQRAEGFDNLWFGAIPETEDGRGQVVTCSYSIEELVQRVVCNSFATLGMPL